MPARFLIDVNLPRDREAIHFTDAPR